MHGCDTLPPCLARERNVRNQRKPRPVSYAGYAGYGSCGETKERAGPLPKRAADEE
jgi:hypothetical protein